MHVWALLLDEEGETPTAQALLRPQAFVTRLQPACVHSLCLRICTWREALTWAAKALLVP